LSILSVICIIFSIFEARHFIEYEGSMKRGMKIGSEFLSEDMIRYFRNFSSDVTSDETKAFIKKEDQTVLIQPIPYFFHKNLGLWYIGVIDLSKRRLKLTYYTPISGVVFIILLISMFGYQLVIGTESEIFRSFCMVIFIPFLYAI